jgi:hypothetical protein
MTHLMIFSFLSFLCVKGNYHSKTFSPPFQTRTAACNGSESTFVSAHPHKRTVLLTLSDNPDEPMTENNSGAAKSGF